MPVDRIAPALQAGLQLTRPLHLLPRAARRPDHRLPVQANGRGAPAAEHGAQHVAFRAADERHRRRFPGLEEAHDDEDQDDPYQVVVKVASIYPTNEEGSVSDCKTIAGCNPDCAGLDGQLGDPVLHALVAFVRHAREAFPADGNGRGSRSG